MSNVNQPSSKGYVPSILLKDRQLLFSGSQLTKYASIACQELYINPDDLIPKKLSEFKAPDVPDEIAEMRYLHFVNKRKNKLVLIRDYIVKHKLKNGDRQKINENDDSLLNSNSISKVNEFDSFSSKILSKSLINREKSILAFEKNKQSLLKYREEIVKKIKTKEEKFKKLKTKPSQKKIDKDALAKYYQERRAQKLKEYHERQSKEIKDKQNKFKSFSRDTAKFFDVLEQSKLGHYTNLQLRSKYKLNENLNQLKERENKTVEDFKSIQDKINSFNEKILLSEESIKFNKQARIDKLKDIHDRINEKKREVMQKVEKYHKEILSKSFSKHIEHKKVEEKKKKKILENIQLLKDQEKYQNDKVSKNLESLRREELNKRKDMDKNMNKEKDSLVKALQEAYNAILKRKEKKRLRKLDQIENYERAKKLNQKLKIGKIQKYNKSLEKLKIAKKIIKRDSPQPHLTDF